MNNFARAMREPPFLFMLALVAVAAFHLPALFALQTEAEFWARIDASGLRTRLTTQSPWVWWVGPWPLEGAPCYRPLSALAYWLMWKSGASWGYSAPIWLSWVLFSFMTWSAGLLALRFTRSHWAAFFVVVGCGANTLGADGWEPHTLLWWALADNYLAVGFWLLSLAPSREWLENRRAPLICFAFTMLLGAALSKELAYFAPFTWLVLAVYRVRPDHAAWCAVAASFGIVAAVYGLRGHFIPNPYNGSGSIVSIAETNFWLLWIRRIIADSSQASPSVAVWHLLDHAWDAVKGLMQIGAIFALCRYFWPLRRPSTVGAILWLIVVALVATPGFVPRDRYTFLPWCFLCLALAVIYLERKVLTYPFVNRDIANQNPVHVVDLDKMHRRA